MNNEMVSVLMPVFNGEKFLIDSVRSILDQTYKNLELIIIDDGSTDNSLKIIRKLAKDDSRIKFYSQKNMGIIASLNRALSLSNGNYIARMDSDDFSIDTRIENQLKFLKKNKLDICGGHCEIFDENGMLNSIGIVPLSHITCKLSLFFKVPFFHPSVLIKKSFLEKNNLRYGQSSYRKIEDLDLWIRMFKCGAKFGNIDRVVLRYRLTNGSLSKINNRQIKIETRQILSDFISDPSASFNKIVNELPQKLNSEEKSLVVRYIWYSFKRLNFRNFKLLKDIDNKIILRTILSEILR